MECHVQVSEEVRLQRPCLIAPSFLVFFFQFDSSLCVPGWKLYSQKKPGTWNGARCSYAITRVPKPAEKHPLRRAPGAEQPRTAIEVVVSGTQGISKYILSSCSANLAGATHRRKSRKHIAPPLNGLICSGEQALRAL
jgi:hypothetical protein